KSSFNEIRALSSQPLTSVQNRFSAMAHHLEGIWSGVAQQQRESMGGPTRLKELADVEIRQSLLFNIGTVVRAALASATPAARIRIDSREEVSSRKVDVIRGATKAIVGRVFIVSKAEDVLEASRRASSGERLILVKD